MPSMRVPRHFKQKQANEELRLDTDILVFDRISYDATRSLLDHARRSAIGEKTPQQRSAHANEAGTEAAPRKRLPEELDNMLRMVDAFHTVFTASHGPIDQLGASARYFEGELRILHFRLLLLRLTVLFIARRTTCAASPSVDALASLRKSNRVRAVTWGERVGSDTRVFPAAVLKWYAELGDRASGNEGEDRDEEMSDAGPEARESDSQSSPVTTPPQEGPRRNDADHGDIQELDDLLAATTETEDSSPELLDLIPLFVRLTHYRSATDSAWHTTEQWLRLAAEMMLQASIELLLLHHSSEIRRSGEGVLVEAFAWGVEGRPKDQQAARDENAVFLLADEEGTAREGLAWTKLREEYMTKLLPELESMTEGSHTIELTDAPAPTTADHADKAQITRLHLESLTERYPVAAFERQMLSFLDGLCESYTRPVLSQLDDEDGEVAPLILGEDLEVERDELSALRKILQARG